MPLSRTILDADPVVRLEIAKCPEGTTQSIEQIDEQRAIERNWERVKKLVAERDRFRCRLCGKRCSYGSRTLNERADPHHIIFASALGPDTTANVLLLCREDHDLIHKVHKFYLSGDADAKDEMNRGMVKVERQIEGGFEVVGFI